MGTPRHACDKKRAFLCGMIKDAGCRPWWRSLLRVGSICFLLHFPVLPHNDTRWCGGVQFFLVPMVGFGFVVVPLISRKAFKLDVMHGFYAEFSLPPPPLVLIFTSLLGFTRTPQKFAKKYNGTKRVKAED
ncbi:unnamed protein product [Pylaiella littoralis]